MKMKFNVLLPIFLALLYSIFCLASEDLLEIPSSVKWIYVFLQDANSVKPGSGQELDSMMTPKEFLSLLPRYRKEAIEQNKQLIITAQTNDGKWIQDQITYQGKRLRPARYYNPGINRVSPGVEIPLQ